MGPWSHSGTTGHVGDVNFGTGAAIDVMGFRGRFADLEIDWLSQWLAPDVAEETPRPKLPPVLLFVMGSNQWREENEWPLSRAVETSLFLRAGAGLSFDAPDASEAPDTFIYDPADGDPDGGIPPGTAFSDIPDTWFCPVCGARKRDFTPYED